MTTPLPNQVPGSFSIPAVAPVYVDGINVNSANLQTPSSATKPDQRFWSSPPRPIGDINDDILVVNLPSAQLVNYISFDLPHFPHVAQVFWQAGPGESDTGLATFNPVLTANGTPLIITTSGSVPAMVNVASAIAATVNPYHYGAGHWVHYDESITPFTGTSIIIACTRKFSGPGGYPVDASGHPSAYPLGVRGLDFGYRATKKSDLPVTGRSSSVLTEREPFAVVTDILGSPVQLSVRENRASDLLQGSTWKSAPQPYPYAVVLLYADARDSNGDPQVIDGVTFNPITSGVSVNVYYSTDPPPSQDDFPAVDTPLSFPATSSFGAAVPVVGTDGILFGNAPSWLEIDNASVQWDPGLPWWLAMEVMPQFPSTDAGTYSIADYGVFQVLWNGTAGAWQLTSGGGIMTVQPFAHAINDRIYLTAAWDGQNLIFAVPGGGFTSVPMAGSPEAASFLLGAIDGQPSLAGNFRLRTMVLKQEQVSFNDDTGLPALPPQIAAFIADSISFITPAVIPASDNDSTLNSLLRFCTDFCLGPSLDINPFGFVGGPGDIYENVSWTPVARDAKVAAGTLSFDPVLCSCVKFEFTNLLATTFDYYGPVVKTVRTMPPAGPANPRFPLPRVNTTAPSTVRMTPAQSLAASQSPSAPVPDTGLAVNQSVAPTVSWPDSRPLTPPSSAGAGLPTEALTAADPATAQALARFGSLYQMQAWQQEPSAPQFSQTGVHSYQEVDVVQQSRTAYYVGLAGLSLSRVSYVVEHDPARYTDLFMDTANIDPASLLYENPSPQPWMWQPGKLSTGPDLADFAQVKSLVFPSTRNVTAIQFASQQSDAVQLLFDPDFSDPLFRAWRPIGDAAALAQSTEFASPIGEMANVARIPSQFNWELLSENFSSWGAIEATGDTWEQLIGAALSLGFGGISSVGPVITTRAGRVYAAARVFSPTALEFPLHLQIIDAASGGILADMPWTIQPNVPNEWFVGFTLGSAVITTETWSDVMGTFGEWGDLEGIAWENISLTSDPPGSTMLVQLVQYGISDDVWEVDTLSLFEDSIVWEFSSDAGNSSWPAYDIRNNPAGVMVFPAPTGALSAGTQLMWRVSGYRPNLQVNSLAIRPWYGSLPGGVRSGIPVAGGPNLNILDHYPPIASDPRWKAWSNPVPQDWWFSFRQQLAMESPGPAAPVPPSGPTAFITPHVIMFIPPPESGGGGGSGPVSGPVTYSDVYPDPYTGFYGAPDGGDVYTDNFGNNTYAFSDDPH